MSKTPFVESAGKLYVEIRATGIHPLCIVTDGWMKIVLFPPSKRAHVLLDDAIRWHVKELEATGGRAGNKKVLALLEKARQQLSGTVKL